MTFPYESLEKFITEVSPHLNVNHDVQYEAEKCRGIVEWAFAQQPFEVGDFVYYLKAERLAKVHGWYSYKDVLSRAPLQVREVDFNQIHGYWYAKCVLKRYEFWSYYSQANLDEVQKAYFHIPLEHLAAAGSDDVGDAWLATSKREQNEAKRLHEEEQAEKQRAKECKCKCDCKGCGK